MSFSLSNDDHEALDKMIETLLDAYKNGKITKLETREHFAQFICAGVVDNESEFKNYIRHNPEILFE